LDGGAGLGAIFPAGGAEQFGGVTHDIQRIGFRQMRQILDTHLLQASNHRGPHAFDGKEGLALGDAEGHTG
jgi:hypothetical protein